MKLTKNQRVFCYTSTLTWAIIMSVSDFFKLRSKSPTTSDIVGTAVALAISSLIFFVLMRLFVTKFKYFK